MFVCFFESLSARLFVMNLQIQTVCPRVCANANFPLQPTRPPKPHCVAVCQTDKRGCLILVKKRDKCD